MSNAIENALNSFKSKYREVCEVIEGLSNPVKVKVGFSTSTGIASLDLALGGGLPSGAIEIYGEASSGKTTLLYEIIRQAQEEGFAVALCPSEYVDIPYMRKIGIDLNRLKLITGNYGEAVLCEAAAFLQSNGKAMIALDTATSLRPKEDVPGAWMNLMDCFLSCTLEYGLTGKKSCVILVNQVRSKRSIDPNRFFVDGEVTTAARKIVDHFSARLHLSSGSTHGSEREMVVDIVSSVMSKPSLVLNLPLSSNGGVNKPLDLIRLGLSCGMITREGSWYTLDGGNLGPGIEMAANLLDLDKVMRERLLTRLLDRSWRRV